VLKRVKLAWNILKIFSKSSRSSLKNAAKEEASQLAKELEDKQAKLEAFRVKLLEEGIDPAELISSLKGQATKTKSTREPRPAKYKYIDEDGSEKNLDRPGPHA
jgi:DNA-binding protein H-NS